MSNVDRMSVDRSSVGVASADVRGDRSTITSVGCGNTCGIRCQGVCRRISVYCLRSIPLIDAMSFRQDKENGIWWGAANQSLVKVDLAERRLL